MAAQYRLRDFSSDDFFTFARWVSTPESLFKICGGKFSYPLQQEHMQRFFRCEGETPSRLQYAFEDADSGVMVGSCSMVNMDFINKSAHLAFIAVEPELRGKGVGTAMLQDVLHRGFTLFDFNRISLFVMDDNAAAKHMYEDRLGFVVEGKMRDMVKVENDYQSVYAMSLLKREWKG